MVNKLVNAERRNSNFLNQKGPKKKGPRPKDKRTNSELPLCATEIHYL